MKPATVVPETTATSSRTTSAPSEPTRPGTPASAEPPARSPYGAPAREPSKVLGTTAASSSEPASRPFARPPEAGAQVQRVLLVDDSRSIRTLLKIYLMARAFEYIEAESAEAALKVLETETVDLILTDFHMDGMNGADFAATVRANRNVKVSKIPILMMTGDANAAEVRNKGQKAGINAFVRKPVSCAHLMTLVDTILPPAKKG
jgi:two-component system, chemotaxis family, chemotaxis protein CheY